MRGRITIFVVGIMLVNIAIPAIAGTITVGSKKFTENVIIAEIATQLLNQRGLEVVHRRELGGTRVLWDALLQGDIDIYPEYSGTLIHELFAGRGIENRRQLQTLLSERGIAMSKPLGFNNTYVLGMLRNKAEKLNINSISDLQKYPGLRFGFSNEFMSRADGWPGLRARYHLDPKQVRGLDHDLAYRGLAGDNLDVIDLYSTDAEIPYYGIKPLQDDKSYFPDYLAVFLYRKALLAEHPEIPGVLQSLAGTIDNTRMAAMNADVKLNGVPDRRVAAAFLSDKFGIKTEDHSHRLLGDLIRNTLDHLTLVVVSLSAAIILAIPLGVVAARKQRAGQAILAITGIIQTVPSLALLVFMIPLLGIGGPPAIAALFLYSLLPIVRNTYSGLHDIPKPVIESAIAMGLPSMARMRLVELPLAMRSILAGIKTSAVINIGTATLGALIGAGGYGQPILTGIRLNDIGLILQGAVPAAVLALLVQGMFEMVEKFLLPRGLKYREK